MATWVTAEASSLTPTLSIWSRATVVVEAVVHKAVRAAAAAVVVAAEPAARATGPSRSHSPDLISPASVDRVGRVARAEKAVQVGLAAAEAWAGLAAERLSSSSKERSIYKVKHWLAAATAKTAQSVT